MYTATKSLGRFRQPKSVEDEKKSVDNAIPKSTAYKTKWSCKVFEEWKQNRLVKSCTLEPGGLFTTKYFEEGVQTLDTAITDMSACSVNYWLSKFVQEDRSINQSMDFILREEHVTVEELMTPWPSVR
ncbi:hypothetical protein pdam_00004592 [Pocillopora damicornis]|uniref:Uncharacterized protein n=2 Tax=Pocillopora TaxID=46730 RepID=A0A3M6ULP6_POCDA|nr:hypothetical protein pdam_00004592 [Pocillopora damicornis]CAH3168425.1 unnamed protein product [Pocillopora meandrina]